MSTCPTQVGTSTIERTKTESALCDTDVIVISARANTEQLQRFKKAGATEHLTTLLNASGLLKALDRVVVTSG